MRLSEYLDTESDMAMRDVYLVGTGPSMDYFPRSYLRGRFCVLLNDAHRYFPELGPAVAANNRGFIDGATQRLKFVKGRLRHQSSPSPKRHDNHVSWDDPDRIVWSYFSRSLGDERDHFDLHELFAEVDYLWNTPGGSISIFAAQIAYMAGAKSITLVGCDCATLGKRAYIEEKGPATKASKDYDAYRRGLITVRDAALREGVPIISMSPFFGLTNFEEQASIFGAKE